jgi:hypothetical protein
MSEHSRRVTADRKLAYNLQVKLDFAERRLAELEQAIRTHREGVQSDTAWVRRRREVVGGSAQINSDSHIVYRHMKEADMAPDSPAVPDERAAVSDVNLGVVWVKMEGGPHDGLSQLYELGWPPPEAVTVVVVTPGVCAVGRNPAGGNDYVQVSRSRITDEQAAAMPNVQRGALYSFQEARDV